LRAGRRAIDEAPPVPIGPPFATEPTPRRRRAFVRPLVLGAVAFAAASAVAWSDWPDALRLEWLKMTGGADRIAPPPSSPAAARSEALPQAPAVTAALPAVQAGPVQEARVAQPAPAHPPPKPTLTVPTITATTGQRVHVRMRIEPTTFSTNAFQVSVRGLPKGARFVQGAATAPDRWVIPASDLGALELALGDSTMTGRFDLGYELRGADGKPIAETTSVLFVTAPVAAAAPATTASLPPPRDTPAPAGASRSTASAPVAALGDSDRVDEAGQQKLLIQGLRLLVLGNINSSRLLFRRAADAGNAHAALILGDTFDAERLVQFGVVGVQPDHDNAVYWYERADELGAPEAKERLADLNTR
jgi:hypothetical protein